MLKILKFKADIQETFLLFLRKQKLPAFTSISGTFQFITLVKHSVYGFIFGYISIKNCAHFRVQGILILKFGVPIDMCGETQHFLSHFAVWWFPKYYKTAAAGTRHWVENFYFSKSLCIYKRICYTLFGLTTFSGCLYMHRQRGCSL
jgi:hypothetical protein